MSVTPTRDRRAERRAATRAEILAAATELIAEHGVAALSLRDLGARVGMRAQSLYSYFDAKEAIYDALFQQGSIEYLERVRALPVTDDPRADLRRGTRDFIDFCVEDSARYQLLLQRTIPGFEPSPEAFAPAVAGLEAFRERAVAGRRRRPARSRPADRARDRPRRPADLERPRRRPLDAAARRGHRHVPRAPRCSTGDGGAMTMMTTRVEDHRSRSRVRRRRSSRRRSTDACSSCSGH